jgi:hypothetical protein
MIYCAASRVSAISFSISMEMPRRAASRAIGKCSTVGVAIDPRIQKSGVRPPTPREVLQATQLLDADYRLRNRNHAASICSASISRPAIARSSS